MERCIINQQFGGIEHWFVFPEGIKADFLLKSDLGKAVKSLTFMNVDENQIPNKKRLCSKGVKTPNPSRFSHIDILLKIALPPSTLGILGRIFGALSLFALLQHSLNFGLSSTFILILDVYSVALRATIGLLDPVVLKFIQWVNETFSFQISFSDGWRHIFLLLQILFIRDASTAFSDGRRYLGLVRLLVGVCVAFSAAVFAFVADLESALLSNAILCVIPIIGLLLYDVTMYAFTATLFFDSIGAGEVKGAISPKSFFILGIKRSIFRFFYVSCASLLLFSFPSARTLEFPGGGLLATTVGLVANATYWIILGANYAVEQSKKGKTYKEAFLESEAGRFGLSVVGLLFWFAFFSSLNAGMRILGF